VRMLSAVIVPEDQRNLDVETLVKSGEVEQEILSTILEQRTDLLIMGELIPKLRLSMPLRLA
jgi:hypothetical protein